MVKRKIFLSLNALTLIFILPLLGQKINLPYEDWKIKIFYSAKYPSLTQDFEMFIDQNGVVHLFLKDYFNAENKNPKINVKTKRLSKEEFLSLKEKVWRADIFNLKDEYIESPSPLNFHSQNLIITIDGRTKKILIGTSSLPLRLSNLILKLREIKED